ncbi:FAD-binding oxidoreductase [Brevibacterium sp. 50QC2O2]|uniref:NAD(P)/FAD-dependent oxidoreductase n=1 Tax=unclassified Brevibacterium TaxID=2614124 RepID=UPI00211D0544|nr:MULTISPECIES: FAD-binding oxidoreductase [unclassified Brevibacterium]MCQ9368781.1 FAD-binding oxidoreductase [Brevibacterium sp. 91QC2O2]MCQ9388574.1 FAD-binding oxidoreductase [Brevibacterium sp. 50QC2O2]
MSTPTAPARPTPAARPAPANATVVIVGGGIMGVASAYELARAGVTDIVVIERNELGSGSTCRAAGGLRSQFSDAVNIALGARSLETFRRFKDLFDQDIDFVGSGYLFLLDGAEDAAAFEDNVAVQRGMGQNSRMLTVAQAAELCPVISTTGLVGAAFNPDDAHCTPESAVAGYARAARRLGVTILTGTSVTGITVESGAVTGVDTSAGPIATGTVVCAAGAWSQQVGALAGVDLPVTPLRRQIVVSEPISAFDARRLPFTIDFSTSFYFHSEGSGLLFGAPEAGDVNAFDTRRDPAWLDHLGELMERRAPALTDVGLGRGWAGLYECTPDHNALIGVAEEVAGFIYACGFSGHGFLQGPAVGEVVRDLYLGTTPFVDVSGMSVQRFATQSTRTELNFV